MVSIAELSPPLLVESLQYPTALIVLFHGSGGNADNLLFLAEACAKSLPYARFWLPQAPAHTSQTRQACPLWYTPSKDGPIGIEIPCEQVLNELEENRVKYGIPSSRVAFVGFSMGVVMAGHMALKLQQACAGLVLLSGRAPHAAMARSSSANQTPVLLCGLHGDHLVPISSFQRSRDALARLGMHVEYHEFPDAGHAIVDAEVDVVVKFLQRRLPPINVPMTPKSPKSDPGVEISGSASRHRKGSASRTEVWR